MSERAEYPGCRDGVYREAAGPSANLWRVANTGTENRGQAHAFIKVVHGVRNAYHANQNEDSELEERGLQWALRFARYFVGEERPPAPYCVVCGLSGSLPVKRVLERKTKHGEATKVACAECFDLDPRSAEELAGLGDSAGNYSLEVFADD